MPDVTAPLPQAAIEHWVPGRMRLRIPARRRNAAFFQNARTELLRLDGITRVDANPETAGILILHRGDGSAILAHARDTALFDIEKPPGDEARKPEPRVQGASAPAQLDLAAIALAISGLVQVARGRVLGSATENLWNAYGVYAGTRQTRVAALLAGFGLLQIMRGEALGSAVSLFLYAWSARRQSGGGTAGDAI